MAGFWSASLERALGRPEQIVSYKRIRLLIVHDAGLCGRVVPRMKEMLEDRAFDVDVAEVGGAIELEPYRGVVVGSAGRGLGLRGDNPNQAIQTFLKEQEGLDEKKLALFTVYLGRPGRMLAQMRELAEGRGATVVVAHPYWLLKPTRGEHILPAECMVRIR